eukprot:m.30023 g.30023  ORF g.30023 m.30023 type:complete len:186 (-) comp8164_c0_seq1:197-754(-)
MAEIVLDIGATRDIAVHSLPCNIEKDGRAAISEYFEPLVQEAVPNRDWHTPYTRGKKRTAGGKDIGSRVEVNFRGRSLRGLVRGLPEGFCGIVLREDGQVHTDKQERQWIGTGRFKAFTQWNLEVDPTEGDKVAKALDWMQIAKALHEPSTEDSLISQEDCGENPKPTLRRSPRKSPSKKQKVAD